jgi:hypothetical protein
MEYCWGYFDGYIDTETDPRICVPAGYIDMARTAEVFVEWAKHHQEKFDEPAALCAAEALAHAYPCPSKE